VGFQIKKAEARDLKARKALVQTLKKRKRQKSGGQKIIQKQESQYGMM
jgi:hypothetical protein